MNKKVQHVAEKLIKHLFGEYRSSIVPGNTIDSVPEYIKTHGLAHSESKQWHLISIDGGHTFKDASADIRNIRPAVACDNILLMDDIFQNHKNRKDWNVWHVDGARDAWIDA